MHQTNVFVALLVLLLIFWTLVQAARPIENRDDASYIVIGTVKAVYLQETKGYRNYVIELLVEQATKGEGLRKGDFFRAFCYQRKAGAAGLEFDTEGHKTVPKEGQRVKVFVNQAGGRYEGIYPDWVDILPGSNNP
jgi:hypothetical protein